MANLKVIAAERARAADQLGSWAQDPLVLRRHVWFVPGFTDEDGTSCWGAPGEDAMGFAAELPEVCANHELATFVDFRVDGSVPHYENFIRFGAALAQRAAGAGGEIDLVCHSMGGLDALSAIALLDDYQPEFGTPPLAGVRNVITFDTPFEGFAAAANPLFRKLKQMQRPDEPWIMSQLVAMDTDSLRIAEVAQARDRFLGRVAAFWPRGADNTGGLIEVPHESASFGDPPDFGAAVRARYRGYRAWEGTSHSGSQGVTRDPRAIVEALQILTAP